MTHVCPQDEQQISVSNASDALYLAQIIDCTGSGSFAVDWMGKVQIEATITIPNGVFLQISGSDGAIIDGRNKLRTFNVSSGSLHLSSLALENGYAESGAAIEALLSHVTLVNCSFTGNNATEFGGAISVDGTTLVLQGTNYFGRNTADSQGGAIRAENSSVLLSGNSSFELNTAGRGGAIATITDCQLNLTGISLFQDNNGTTSGGGIFGLASNMIISGDGVTSRFSGNSALSEFGGGIYWRGEDETHSISIEMPLEMVSNSAPTGGAIYLSGEGLQVKLDGIHFQSNVASKNGGALVAYLSGLEDRQAVIQDCSFEGNTAEISGGAMVISEGFVTTRDCIFENNLAGEPPRCRCK